MNKKKINRKVLVIGSELEGIVLCEELANKGFEVILVDNNNCLGGRLNNNKLSFLYFDLNEKIKSIGSNKNIQILKNTTIVSISGAIGEFKISLLNEDVSVLEASIVVLCTSVDFVPSFDYMSHNFISFSQLKDFFNPQGITRSDILKIANRTYKKIALYVPQDSTSRYIVNEFFQHALFLKNRYGADISLILPQVLVAGDELEKIYREIREAGILIFKYNNQPELKYLDMENISINFMDQVEGNIKIDADLLIYSEKIVDSIYFKELKTIFKLCDFNNINFQLLNSSRKGVYLCGLCREDLLNNESNQDAIALAEEINEVLKNGIIEYESGVIDIDKKKCTLCLTCVRACPHAAIEMDRNILDERVIKIYDEACFHCGICVGECPTKALTYKEQIVSV